MTQLVLSLFPGIGLLDMAFELEGFCVVRGPDVLWGGDIRKFHPPVGKFDGVIGGPPCQAFSRLAHLVRHNGYKPKFGNLIPEFERCIAESQPAWFVMENVPAAPMPQPLGYATWSTLLNNRQCFDETGEPAKQNRVRRWTFGDKRHGQRTVLMIDTAALESRDFEYAAVGGDDGLSAGQRRRKYKSGVMGRTNRASTKGLLRLLRLQGLSESWNPEALTLEAKCSGIRNGVPLPMGRAIAKAVREATT